MSGPGIMVVTLLVILLFGALVCLIFWIADSLGEWIWYSDDAIILRILVFPVWLCFFLMRFALLATGVICWAIMGKNFLDDFRK